jgi:hypothetical protein
MAKGLVDGMGRQRRIANMTLLLLALLAPTPHARLMTWPVFASYLCGPEVAHPPCGHDADLDVDGDVDLADVALFQNAYRCFGFDLDGDGTHDCGWETRWETEP